MSAIKPSEDIRRKAIQGFIRLFEDALIRVVSKSEVQGDFEPPLIVDLREGSFQAFVLSLGTKHTFINVPREIRIEDADGGITTAVRRTPLVAYRRKSTERWRACSPDRLSSLRTSSDYELVDDIFGYALKQPLEKCDTVLARMLFAYLSLLSQTDDGQDYSNVIVIVDHAEYVSLLQSALTQLGPRLDKGENPRWSSALILPIDKGTDIRGFAFLASPAEFSAAQKFLLISGPKSAEEYAYDGSQFRVSKPGSKLDLTQYQRIIVVGLPPKGKSDTRVVFFQGEAELQQACLAGYVYWWLQIDERRLETLQAKYVALEQQLSSARARRQQLEHLTHRLKTLLSELMPIPGEKQ